MAMGFEPRKKESAVDTVVNNIKKLILDSTWAASMDGIDTSANFNLETLTYATIVVSVIPMLAVYPWLQKYFVKGLTVGAVKG